MQRIKDILGKYGKVLIYATLILCSFSVMSEAFAQDFLSDLAKDFSKGYTDAIQNKIRDIREIASAAAQFAVDASNTVVGALEGIYNAIVDILVGTCPQASVYYQNHLGGCWSCTIFDTIFTALNSFATETYYRIAPSCAMLMMICAMIWIGVFTIRYIGALHGQEPAEYLTKLFGLLLKTMAVGALLLVSASTFAHLIISPVVVASSDLSVAILQSFTEIREQVVDKTTESSTTASCDSGKGCAVQPVECDKDGNCKITEGNTVRFTPLACELMKTEPEMGGLLYDGEATPKDEKLLNDQIYYSLMCMVNNLHYEIAYVVSLASAMICYAWTANTTWFLPFKYLSLKMLISGIFIFGIAILISIAYVFKLIDAVFRLSVLCVLLPLLAVAWVFPATVDYAKKGFSMLVHVMIMFITLAIVVSLVLMLVLVAFTSNDGDTSLFQLFNENRIYDMNNILDFFSLNFLFGLISLFLAFKLLDVVDHMASEFSGVSVGTSVGDQLSMVLAKCGANITKSVTSVAKTGFNVAYQSLGSRIMQTNLGHRFHVASRKFGLNTMRSLGFAPPASAMKSVSSLQSFEFEVADLAGTAKLDVLTKNIADAKHIMKLKADLEDYKNNHPSPSLLEKAEIKRREDGIVFHEKDNPEAARYANNIYDLAYAQKVEGRARALEMAYGKDTLSSLANEQKEQLMLGKEVKDKGNLEKVTKTDYKSLNNMDGAEFKALEEKTSLAEKVRNGSATDDEKKNVAKMVSSGDTDMRNLLAMQERDFDEQKALIRNTKETADKAKIEVQKEFKRIADEQGWFLEAQSIAKDITASKGADLAAVAAYDALPAKYKHENTFRVLDINEEKDRREQINTIASSLTTKGWDVGEDTYVKGLEKAYAAKLGSDFYDIVWK